MNQLKTLAWEYKDFVDKQTEYRKAEFLKLLHLWDEDFFNHKPPNLKSKDKQHRYLWLPTLGIIKFKRRRYYDIKTKKYIYLLDKHLNIPKNKMVLREHEKLALMFYTDLPSYAKISEMVFDGNVSKMTIGRYIKDNDLDIAYKSYKCEDPGILYINADGLWTSLWKSKKQIETKNFTFYTGKERISSNRHKLLNRNILSTVGKSMREIVEEVTHVLKHYAGVLEIRVAGDGANWIKSLANKLNATFYLDKFHFNKTIVDLVGKQYMKLILNDVANPKFSKKDLREKLLMILADKKSGELNKNGLQKIGYVVNNLHHYRMSLIDNIESSIEAIQAHYVAKNLKRSRKGFKAETLLKILKIKISHANGFFGHEAWTDKVDVDIGIFGRTGKNIPIFQYGDSGSSIYKKIQQMIRN